MERKVYQDERKNTNMYLTVLFLLFLPYFFRKPSAFPTLAFFPLYWFCTASLQWGERTTEAPSTSFRGATVTKPWVSLEKNYFRLLLNTEKIPNYHWVIYFAWSAWTAIWTYGSIWFINIQQDTWKSAVYAILNYRTEENNLHNIIKMQMYLFNIRVWVSTCRSLSGPKSFKLPRKLWVLK